MKGDFEKWREENRGIDSWYEKQITDSDLSFMQRVKLLWEYIKLVIKAKKEK